MAQEVWRDGQVTASGTHPHRNIASWPSQYLHIFVKYHQLCGSVIGGRTKLELDTSNEIKQKDFLRGVLDKIVVKSEYGFGRDKTKKIQRKQILDFYYKLKVVDDGFEWTDKTTSPWTSRTIEGTEVDQSPMVRLVSPRLKKRK